MLILSAKKKPFNPFPSPRIGSSFLLAYDAAPPCLPTIFTRDADIPTHSNSPRLAGFGGTPARGGGPPILAGILRASAAAVLLRCRLRERVAGRRDGLADTRGRVLLWCHDGVVGGPMQSRGTHAAGSGLVFLIRIGDRRDGVLLASIAGDWHCGICQTFARFAR